MSPVISKIRMIGPTSCNGYSSFKVSLTASASWSVTTKFNSAVAIRTYHPSQKLYKIRRQLFKLSRWETRIQRKNITSSVKLIQLIYKANSVNTKSWIIKRCWSGTGYKWMYGYRHQYHNILILSTCGCSVLTSVSASVPRVYHWRQ